MERARPCKQAATPVWLAPSSVVSWESWEPWGVTKSDSTLPTSPTLADAFGMGRWPKIRAPCDAWVCSVSLPAKQRPTVTKHTPRHTHTHTHTHMHTHRPRTRTHARTHAPTHACTCAQTRARTHIISTLCSREATSVTLLL